MVDTEEDGMSEQIGPVEIGPVKIEDGVRYLVSLTYPGTMRAETATRVQRHLDRLLKEWWDSGEKFGCLVIDDAELTVERIDANQTS